MEYTTLGETGLEVSRIGLGCMSFGAGNGDDWHLDQEEARPIIERAIDAGITFFDTANVYSNGSSERIVGNVLDGYDRDRLVVATKTHPESSPEDYPSGRGGLSHNAIERDLAGSLDRLGMDEIDLYQIHRWDDDTPIAGTLRALDDAVRQGRVRYIGASSMWGHQFGSALRASDRHGLERFVSMQNHYNLAYREEEREMLPLCEREGIGVIPWSPLAGGYLARPHEDLTTTERGAAMEETDWLSERMVRYHARGGGEINERVAELADDEGVTMAQIALAWILHKDVVDAPIVGTTSVEHLEDALDALAIDLSSGDIAYLEAPYRVNPVIGHT